MSGSLEVVLALFAVSIAGVFRGFSGFGTGMILVPSLSLIYEPIIAVITVSLLELIPAVQLVKKSLPHCHWRTVLPMSFISIFTVPLGALILVSIDIQTMRIIISVLVMIVVLILFSGWRYKGEAGLKVSAATGLFSGLITGATSLGGLPVILYYLSSDLTREVTRASMIVFLIFTTVVSLLTYISHDIITQDSVIRTVAVSPVFILALWLGGKLFGRVSEALFRIIILGLLSGLSLMMLLS